MGGVTDTREATQISRIGFANVGQVRTLALHSLLPQKGPGAPLPFTVLASKDLLRCSSFCLDFLKCVTLARL